ncbi:MAG: zeta toxin family protein [Clostridia bacterium]|nr:zeta toxin family protein [Clostridia bacterium]
MAEKTGAGGKPQDFDEQNGQYTGEGTTYRQNTGYSEILASDKPAIKTKNFALNDRDSIATYNKITQGGGYSIEELEALPVFNTIQEEIENARYRNAQRLGMPDEYGGETKLINTPEREEARQKWVNDFLNGNGVDTHPQTPLKKESKLTVVVGLPASGKSSRIANPLSEEQGAFIFDSDEMKKLIDGFDGGKNADGIHEESKNLLRRAATAFTNGEMKGTNIVFPIIGDNSRKTRKKLQPFIDAGYDVEIAYKKADTRESMNRVISRAIKDGRFIPRDVVMDYNNDNIINAYNELLKNGIKRSKYSEI